MLLRHYEAAASGRRTQGWRRSRGDANAVIGPAVSSTRSIARDLVRNNAHARRGVKTIANHIVGWGIVPKPTPMNQRARDVWRAWAETTACDADGRNDFYGLQKLVARTVAESGEVLIRRRWRLPDDGLPIPMQIQVIEGDYIDTDRTYDLPNGSGRVINGIEFDPIGRRTAYWLFQEHPGALMFGGGYNSRRVPAEGVAHVYCQERPGQVRGISWLAAVILKMKDFDDYDDAQLMKQKMAALLAVIVRGTGNDTQQIGSPQWNGSDINVLEPGALIQVPEGSDIDVVQPPRTTEYEAYSEVTLRTIAAGMDLTYESLTGDFTNLPFSAARMSRLEHWENVNDWRWQMMVPQMCDPVWRWAMEAAAIVSKIDAPPAALWTAPPLPMLDPANEGLAYQRNIRSGLQSQSEALRERGYDPDEVFEEMATDNAKLDALGLVLDSDPRRMTQAGQAQPAPAADAAAPAVTEES